MSVKVIRIHRKLCNHTLKMLLFYVCCLFTWNKYTVINLMKNIAYLLNYRFNNQKFKFYYHQLVSLLSHLSLLFCMLQIIFYIYFSWLNLKLYVIFLSQYQIKYNLFCIIINILSYYIRVFIILFISNCIVLIHKNYEGHWIYPRLLSMVPL